MSGEAQLEALLELINTSARSAIAEYKKSGNDVPTINSKTFHPIDFAIDTIALKKSVRLLESACQQLCVSLASPQHTAFNYVSSFESACIGVVVRAKVADVLQDYPNGLHVDELAKLVSLEKGKLARVLRLLAMKGCFTEVKLNTYANNRISLVTVSSSEMGALLGIGTDTVSQGSAVLYETMTEPEYAASYHPDKAPVIYARKKKGFKGNYFDSFDADQRETFHRAMIGMNYVTGSLSILYHYPWNEVNTFCDIGASVGTVSIPLSKMYPHLKITDQDLPEVMAQAKDVWTNEAPEALQNNQVELVPLDFFEECPVYGQDVYYLRHIIHNWPDAEAAVILTNVTKAMAPHSRLLIQDYVITPDSRDPSVKSYGGDAAPEPLLPNFGNGNNRMYQQDLKMWMKLNAKERTLDEVIMLGSLAGLVLEKVYDLAESGVLQFKVAA